MSEFVLKTIYKPLTKDEIEAGMKACFGDPHLRKGLRVLQDSINIDVQRLALENVNFPRMVGEYVGEFK